MNSSVGKSPYKRIRTSSSMLSKERNYSNKKRDDDLAYDTALSAALDRYEYSVNMQLKRKLVESCRTIINNINNTLLASCEQNITRTTLQRYKKRLVQKNTITLLYFTHIYICKT